MIIMKYIIVACTLFTISAAAVLPDTDQAKTIEYENTNNENGSYKYSFATSNGIEREETRHLVNVGEKNEHFVVEGSYSYTDPNENYVSVKYTADEKGFHILQLDIFPNEVADRILAPNVVASLLGK